MVTENKNAPSAPAKAKEDKAAEEKSIQDKVEKAEAAKAAIDKGVAPAESPAEATNPKFAAQPGTLPPSMQGVALPHPSTDKPTPALDTPEMAKARARANADVEADTDDNAPKNIGEPVGEPIQCIVKRKFQSPNGAIVRPGATYWYQRRKGEVFPYRNLEPVSESLGKSLRADARKAEEEKISRMKTREERREAFRRLAAETE